MPMLGHCLVAVHASSALNAQLASTLSLGSHAARNRPNASAGPVFPRTGRSHPLCGPPIPGSSEDQESLITRSVGAASASHAAWDLDAVHGMHAMHSGNIPRSVGRRQGSSGYFGMILPGLRFRPGSMAVNNPSIMCTPGAEMSCSSHAACSVPTA